MDITLRRLARLGAGVLVVVLAGCSAGAGQQDPPEGQPSSSSPETGSGMEIAHPKDAAAVDVCDLLPEEAATSLGVDPQGKRKSNDLKPGLPDYCFWSKVDDRSSRISLAAIDDRSIESYYENKSEYKYFKKIEIENYPSVIAMKSDPKKVKSCAVYMAVSKNQIVTSTSSLSVEDSQRDAPCSLAKKVLRLSVSSWPDA